MIGDTAKIDQKINFDNPAETGKYYPRKRVGRGKNGCDGVGVMVWVCRGNPVWLPNMDQLFPTKSCFCSTISSLLTKVIGTNSSVGDPM